jgi:hypothetical protein
MRLESAIAMVRNDAEGCSTSSLVGQIRGLSRLLWIAMAGTGRSAASTLGTPEATG